MTDQQRSSWEQERDNAANEFLSQFCISPGTPHWLAGERDFKSGADFGREWERERSKKLVEALKLLRNRSILNGMRSLNWEVADNALSDYEKEQA